MEHGALHQALSMVIRKSLTTSLEWPTGIRLIRLLTLVRGFVMPPALMQQDAQHIPAQGASFTWTYSPSPTWVVALNLRRHTASKITSIVVCGPHL